MAQVPKSRVMFEFQMQSRAAEGFTHRLKNRLGQPAQNETWLRAEDPDQAALERN